MVRLLQTGGYGWSEGGCDMELRDDDEAPCEYSVRTVWRGSEASITFVSYFFEGNRRRSLHG